MSSLSFLSLAPPSPPRSHQQASLAPQPADDRPSARGNKRQKRAAVPGRAHHDHRRHASLFLTHARPGPGESSRSPPRRPRPSASFVLGLARCCPSRAAPSLPSPGKPISTHRSPPLPVPSASSVRPSVRGRAFAQPWSFRPWTRFHLGLGGDVDACFPNRVARCRFCVRRFSARSDVGGRFARGEWINLSLLRVAVLPRCVGRVISACFILSISPWHWLFSQSP
jgi:hypothetical protein